MTFKPETRHPSYAHEREDFSKFDPEQQDAILAEMQSVARLDWKSAATVVDRESAVAAFSHAAQARENLMDVLGQRRAHRDRQRYG